MAMQPRNWHLGSYDTDTWTAVVADPAVLAGVFITNTSDSPVSIALRLQDVDGNMLAMLVSGVSIEPGDSYQLPGRSLAILTGQRLAFRGDSGGATVYVTGVVSDDFTGTDPSINYTTPSQVDQAIVQALQDYLTASEVAQKINTALQDYPSSSQVDSKVSTALGDYSTTTQMNTAISSAIDDLVNGAPGALDTLKELADALGDDEQFAASVTNQLGQKLNASDYTADDVLAKLLTVDADDSGLNATTLQGKAPGDFESAGTAQGLLQSMGIGAETVSLIDDHDFNSVDPAGTFRFIHLTSASNGPDTDEEYGYYATLGVGDVADNRSVQLLVTGSGGVFLHIHGVQGGWLWIRLPDQTSVESLINNAVNGLVTSETFDALVQRVTALENNGTGGSGGGTAAAVITNDATNPAFIISDSNSMPVGWSVTNASAARRWDSGHYALDLTGATGAPMLSSAVEYGELYDGDTVRFGIDVATDGDSTGLMVLQTIAGQTMAHLLSEGSRIASDRAISVDDPDSFTLDLATRVTPQISWFESASGPSGRWAHQAASDGRYLYVYGGRGDDGFDFWNSDSAKSDLWRLDTIANTWEELSPTAGADGAPGPLSAGAMHYHNGRLYLIGGVVARQYYSDDDLESAHAPLVWILPLDTMTWERGADSPKPLFWHGSTVLGDSIITVGGYVDDPGGIGNGSQPWVLRYSITNDSWDQLNDMPYLCNNPSLTHIDGKLYMHGGYNPGYHAELYQGTVDGSTISWAQMSDGPVARTTFAFFPDAERGMLYAIGGNTADGITGDVSVYTIADDTWYQLGSTPFDPVRFLSANLCADRVVMFGGWDGDTVSSQAWQLRSFLGARGGDVVSLPDPDDAFPLATPEASTITFARPQLARVSQYGNFTAGSPRDAALLAATESPA